MNTVVRTLGMLSLCTILDACVLPPHVETREHPLAAKQLGLGAVPTTVTQDAWWQSFGDTQLNGLVEQSLRQSPSLAEAMARLREVQARRDAAHARIFPSYNVNATETWQRFSGNDIYPPPFGGSRAWRGSVEGDISWDIDFWGRQRALIDSATQQGRAAELDIASARLALTGSLVRVYVSLERSYALAEIATRAEAQRLDILRITRERVDAGLDTNVEFREASGSVPQARVERSQAEVAAELAKHELAALTGKGADEYASIERPHLDFDTAFSLPEALPADLLARRPDVVAARFRVEATDSLKAAAKAAFYPQVNLSAFAGWASIGLSDLFKADSRMYGIGPSIYLPIFDSARLKAEYRGANASLDAAIAAYNSTVLQAVRQVADQLTNIDALKRQVNDQQQRLDATEEAFRLVNKRYSAGLASYLSVLTAETQVLDARRQRVDLISSLATARVSLLVALGGSFTPEQPLTTASAR